MWRDHLDQCEEGAESDTMVEDPEPWDITDY
jgi:hypothetical protein